jgi:hypothetical protein
MDSLTFLQPAFGGYSGGFYANLAANLACAGCALLHPATGKNYCNLPCGGPGSMMLYVVRFAGAARKAA